MFTDDGETPGITIWHRVYTPDCIGDGDISYLRVYEEFIPCPGDEDMSPAQDAAGELIKRGLTEFSRSDYSAHGWFTDPDGSQVYGSHGNYTGEKDDISGHLVNFENHNPRAVFERVTVS